MTREREELARYQAALVAELGAGGTADAIVARLRARGFDAEIDRALSEADPRAIEIASLLAQKWGRKAR